MAGEGTTGAPKVLVHRGSCSSTARNEPCQFLAPPEISRDNLWRRGGRLCISGSLRTFPGGGFSPGPAQRRVSSVVLLRRPEELPRGKRDLRPRVGYAGSAPRVARGRRPDDRSLIWLRPPCPCARCRSRWCSWCSGCGRCGRSPGARPQCAPPLRRPQL